MKMKNKLSSFDMHTQVEDEYDASTSLNAELEPELVVVDATTDGTENEYRIVKIDGMFYLEVWDSTSQVWNVTDSLTPFELLTKLKG